MKKVVFLLLLAATTAGFAQVKVRPGLRLGVNSATLSNVGDADRKYGVYFGAFANIHFTRFYELQPEVNFSAQGTKFGGYTYYNYEGDPLASSGEEDFKLNYAGVTLTNKFFVVPGLGLHLLAGPAFEFKTNGDFFDDDIMPFDFSFFGGIGYEFPFGLGAEIRYKQGLVDIRDGFYDDYDYEDDTILNSTIQFGLTYKFNF